MSEYRHNVRTLWASWIFLFFFFFSISRHRTIRSILKYNSCSLVYSIYVYMYRSATLCYSIHFSGFRFGRFFALPENGLATHLDCSCVRIFYVQFVNRVPICVSFVFSPFTSVCVVFFLSIWCRVRQTRNTSYSRTARTGSTYCYWRMLKRKDLLVA